MSTCFVIQPFDGGTFDRRYKDTFEPAIRASGFDPYRVDNDPSASIPIERIEEQIAKSSACFIDITLDNPNVWCELGMAIALKKEVCIVCSDERKSSYPFDIRHRNIIRYGTASQSDWEVLSGKIKDRLAAISKAATSVKSLPKEYREKAEKGDVATQDIIVMATLFESMTFPSRSESAYNLRQSLINRGLSNFDINLSFMRLEQEGRVSFSVGSDWNGNEYETIVISDEGVDWVANNEAELRKLSVAAPVNGVKTTFNLDDEIPF